MRNITLTYTHNTRDLGQLKTKDGKEILKHKLFRSGHLGKLSSKDIIKLKKYNIKTVIDFRSEDEFINKPDVRIDGVNYINLPALKKDNITKASNSEDSNLLNLVNKEYGGKKLLMNTYKNIFINQEGLIAYKRFFEIITNNKDGAILWHCSQGKDRAGLASFLLEYSLGVSIEDCIKDYLYTNKAMKDKIEELTPIVLKKSNGDESLIPQLIDVFEAKLDYLNAALDTINNKYDGLDNFIKNILNVDVNKLKEKYIK